MPCTLTRGLCPSEEGDQLFGGSTTVAHLSPGLLEDSPEQKEAWEESESPPGPVSHLCTEGDERARLNVLVLPAGLEPGLQS